MGFMAAAIPIATSVLGAMAPKPEQAPAQPTERPPTLGEIFAMNEADFSSPLQSPYNQLMPTSGVGRKE